MHIEPGHVMMELFVGVDTNDVELVHRGMSKLLQLEVMVAITTECRVGRIYVRGCRSRADAGVDSGWNSAMIVLWNDGWPCVQRQELMEAKLKMRSVAVRI